MKLLMDSFWRAGAYCLHPKVIGLSLLPLLVGVVLALGLGWLYWEQAVAGVRGMLESWLLVDAALKWVEAQIGPSFRALLAPLLVVLLAAPLVVVASVLLVALLMVPSMVELVAVRRFAHLERRRGAGFIASLFWSLANTVVALVLLVLSLPLWFIPPLVLVVPPLIWGWLTYRVMAFDTLAAHASRDERRALLQTHRLPLLGIGVVTGFLGAAPSLLWALSVATLIFAPFIIAVSVWLYTLVFAFSALWFTHYGLAALADRRRADGVDGTGGTAMPGPRPVPGAPVGRPGEGEVIDLPVTPAPPALDRPKPSGDAT